MLNAINMWFKTCSCMPLLSLARCPSKHLFLSASLCNGMCKLCTALSDNVQCMSVQAQFDQIMMTVPNGILPVSPLVMWAKAFS